MKCKNGGDSMFKKTGFNAEIKGVPIKDVGTKVGSLFGPKGKSIGEKVDKATKKVTIKID